MIGWKCPILWKLSNKARGSCHVPSLINTRDNFMFPLLDWVKAYYPQISDLRSRTVWRKKNEILQIILVLNFSKYFTLFPLTRKRTSNLELEIKSKQKAQPKIFPPFLFCWPLNQTSVCARVFFWSNWLEWRGAAKSLNPVDLMLVIFVLRISGIRISSKCNSFRI